MKTTIKTFRFLIPALLIFISSCAGLKYNQQAQEQTRKIKDLTAQTIDLSVNKYSDNEATVQMLNDAYKSAITFEQKRGKTNYPTISMWKQIDTWVNVDFVTLWKKQETVGITAIAEIKKRADTLFDHIISLEDNKIK